MPIRIGRIAVAAIAAEVLGIFVLVTLVAIFGPSDRNAAQTYAANLGVWVGPVFGFMFCLLGGLWVARGLVKSHVANGLALGVAGAAIDVLLLLLSGAAFELVFVVSNVGRIVAGTIGGWIAGRKLCDAI